MRRKNQKGVSSLEFAFSSLVMVPLLLGTGVTGVNMIRSLQTIQLARDAGHMYGRGIDFSQPGNKAILGNIGADLGLSTTSGQGSAVVILSALTYVDKATCAAAGAADTSGNPTAACVNYQKWVFKQRLVIGNSSVRSSNYGSPVTGGTTGVNIDSSTGKITLTEYCTKAGAAANFNAINPYANVNGNISGLPSGQALYLAEAASTGFNMAPFVSGSVAYSWGLF